MQQLRTFTSCNRTSIVGTEQPYSANKNGNPKAAADILNMIILYVFILRRAKTSPARPRLNRAIEVGSGAGVGGIG